MTKLEWAFYIPWLAVLVLLCIIQESCFVWLLWNLNDRGDRHIFRSRNINPNLGGKMNMFKKVFWMAMLVAMVFIAALPSAMAQSPGDTVGTTQCLQQGIGSIGNMIAFDSEGGAHFVWMNCLDSFRGIFYNHLSPNGEWSYPENGVYISQNNGDGFPRISVTGDNRAVTAYHNSVINFVTYAVATFPGGSIFSYYDPPDMLTYRCYWPHVAIDRNDRVHIICTENPPEFGDPRAVGYTSSTDGGETWTELDVVDTLMTVSAIITASPVSDRVAIAYTHPTINDSTGMQNNVYYIISEDGFTWDWENGKVNITNYGQNGDSLFAYAECDAVFDYNDNLHISWTAQYLSQGSYLDETFLNHYSTGSGVITEISRSDDEWGPDCEFSYRPICNISLGAQEGTDAIFVAYTEFNPGDCSEDGEANGEVYYAASYDGAGWSLPENLTNSPSPDCVPGNCHSDENPSLAEKVDNGLHLFYFENTRDSGSPNTALYLRYEIPTGVSEVEQLPSKITLPQNYPNPFNATTTFSFGLPNPSRITLQIYNVLGQRICTVVDGYYPAGEHKVAWDGHDMAGEVVDSGIYFAVLTNGEEKRIKFTILK